MEAHPSDLLAAYPGPWDERAAAHLLNRTGFSAPLEKVEAALKDSPDAVLQRLLDYESTPDPYARPDWAEPETDWTPPSLLSEKDKKERQRIAQEHRRELQTWWIRRMASAPRPLQEKLTLFWHGHFATSLEKVKGPYLMWLQNETFRRNAKGNFHTLVSEISQDPAMILWLDNDSNRKEHPNENYARELMELFTLGEGHYTEQDIKESARAFTGWGFRKRDQQFYFNSKQHDSGEKTFMGKQGKWNGNDIVDIIFEQPRCAGFIAEKLWTFFAYENPEPEIIEGLGQILRQSKYELRPVLWKLFSCQAFYSERALRAQIKSPVQLVIGSFQVVKKEFPQKEPIARLLLNVLRLMGQEPFDPPDVSGWEGGLTWVNTASLLLRYNFANYLVHGVPSDNMVGKVKPGKGPQPARPGLKELMRRNAEILSIAALYDPSKATSSSELVRHFARLLWNCQPDKDSFAQFTKFLDTDENGDPRVFKSANADAEQKIRGLIHLMMSTPQYQLC